MFVRFRLTICPSRQGIIFPLSYEYYLSSAIYKWIGKASPLFSEFLHDKGYSTSNVKRSFKHFCFSHLFIQDYQIKDEYIFLNDGKITWFISMPVIEIAQHLIVGLFEKQMFFIGKEENKFIVEQVEILPEPKWDRVMKFKTLSPISVSVPVMRGNKMFAYYLKADDPCLSEALRKNLLQRYESLYGTRPADTAFKCIPDEEYIKKRGGADRVSKLVTIKKGLPDETKVRGFRCPITLEGSVELIKFAYESGLGEKGSMGFGMIEVVA